MEKLSFFSKFTAALAVSAGAVWIGSYLVKIFVMYKFFVPGEAVLRPLYSTDEITIGVQFVLPVFITTFISYFLSVVFFSLFLVTSKLNLKQNGWLFISVIIVLVTLPFEVFLMIIDYKIITVLLSDSFNADLVINLFARRLTSLSSFPMIIILSYISIVFMIIFKPLTLKTKTT